MQAFNPHRTNDNLRGSDALDETPQQVEKSVLPREQGSRVQASRLVGLDFLRFSAALAVVCFHYAPQVSNYGHFPPWIRALIGTGPAAVPFFFILSGFLLAVRANLYSPELKISKSRFWFARFLRLYPAYLIGFFLFLPQAVAKYLLLRPAGTAGTGVFLRSAVLYMLMIQSWTPFALSWNGPSWSLSVEIFFYLLFPFLAGSKLFAARFGYLAIGALGCSAACALTLLNLAGNIRDTFWIAQVRYHPIFWLPFFLLGVGLARFAPLWESLGSALAIALPWTSLLMLLILSAFWPDRFRDLLINGASAPLLAILVLTFSHPKVFNAAFVPDCVIEKLGHVSYMVYIIQAPTWHYYQAALTVLTHHSNAASLGQFASFLFILIGTSFCLERWAEEPIRRLLSQVMLAFNPEVGQITT